MKTIKITVYNVIGNKTYENDPDCNGGYCVTCGTMKEAERELRKCIEADYDGYYEGDDEEHDEADLTAEVNLAVKTKCLSIGDLTVIYDIRKQTVTVPVPKELKALAKAAAEYGDAVDAEMESGDYHLEDTCKTESEIETHNENVENASSAWAKLHSMIVKFA